MNNTNNTNNINTFKTKNAPHIPGTLIESSFNRDFSTAINRDNLHHSNIKPQSNLTRNLKSISANQTISKNFSLPDILQSPQHPFKLVYQKEQLRKGQNQLMLEQLKKKYSNKYLSKFKILNYRCHYVYNNGNQLYLLSPEHHQIKKRFVNKNNSFQSKHSCNNNNSTTHKHTLLQKGNSAKSKDIKESNKSLIESKSKGKSKTMPEMHVEERLMHSKKKMIVNAVKEDINTSCDSDKLDYDNEIFKQLSQKEKNDKQELIQNDIVNNYNVSYLHKKFKLLSGIINDDHCSKNKCYDINKIGVLHFKGFEKRMMQM